MPEHDVTMTEGERGTKRGRADSGSADQKRTQRSGSIDSITKRLEALKGLESISEHAGKKLEIAVPLKGDRVEYYPADYARHKFRGKVDTRNFPKLIKDEDGTRRPLPQAYDSIKVAPGTSPQKAKEIRDGVWQEMQDEIGFASKPSNGKTVWDKLDRNDPQAWYDTPAGPHLTTYAWHNPEKAGQGLPTLSITMKSNNQRGTRTIGVWENDPLVAGKSLKDLARDYGPDKVEIKNKNNIFRSVAKLNERGEHEAERLLAQVRGQEIRYNRDLPDIVVQHKSHLVSVADIQNTKLWENQPVLKHLNEALDERPESLRIGMSNGEGDSLHSPQLMRKLDGKLFERMCEKYHLPQERLAENGKYLKGGPWVQTAEGLLQDAKAVKERLSAGEKLTEKYKNTQIFGPSKIERGENKGSAKSLYATMRDNGPIPPEIAKVLEVAPRLGGREEYKQVARLNTNQALEAHQADDSSSSVNGMQGVKQEPSSARQSLMKDRAGRQESHGL
ncbi:AsmA family protein [Rhizobium binae]|uniref:AsmA family protein n=1 Tax=Rhizobium binae TaxID=1138190 RepID=UPI001C8292E3|nr:AsmA family protein [Rhizobium binae]MBX4967714.1 hypothetical protein [Rhizobium binae]